MSHETDRPTPGLSDLGKFDRILVCGSRYWRDSKTIYTKLEKYSHDDTIIVSGKAPGADSLAEWWAVCTQHDYMGFPARWKKEGNAAGQIRNKRMLVYGILRTYQKGDPALARCLVIGFHEIIEESKGTRNMLTLAKKHGIRTILVRESRLTNKIIDERTRRKR